MQRNLRRLTATIKNPDFDKRFTYGGKSVEVFQNGKLIEYLPEHQGRNTNGKVVSIDPPTAYYDGSVSRVSADAARLLFANSVPAEPKDYHELCIDASVHEEAWATRILQLMLDRGVLKLEQIRETIELLKREDED